MGKNRTSLWMLAVLTSALWVGCGEGSDGRPAEGAGAGKAATGGENAVQITPATAGEILQAVRNSGARAVLVNVWATWCVPCREEFPDMMRLYRTYRDRGLRLILVSADFERQLPQTREFLAGQGVDFPSYLKTGKDTEFIDALDPRWSGALPASWVFDAQGVPRHFWEGRASYGKFEEKVLDVLNETPSRPATGNPP